MTTASRTGLSRGRLRAQSALEHKISNEVFNENANEFVETICPVDQLFKRDGSNCFEYMYIYVYKYAD